jgi:hypothetical protein
VIDAREEGVSRQLTLNAVGIPSAFSVDEKARDQVRLKFLREGIIDPEQEGVELRLLQEISPPIYGEARVRLARPDKSGV